MVKFLSNNNAVCMYVSGDSRNGVQGPSYSKTKKTGGSSSMYETTITVRKVLKQKSTFRFSPLNVPHNGILKCLKCLI